MYGSSTEADHLVAIKRSVVGLLIPNDKLQLSYTFYCSFIRGVLAVASQAARARENGLFLAFSDLSSSPANAGLPKTRVYPQSAEIQG